MGKLNDDPSRSSVVRKKSSLPTVFIRKQDSRNESGKSQNIPEKGQDQNDASSPTIEEVPRKSPDIVGDSHTSDQRKREQEPQGVEARPAKRAPSSLVREIRNLRNQINSQRSDLNLLAATRLAELTGRHTATSRLTTKEQREIASFLAEIGLQNSSEPQFEAINPVVAPSISGLRESLRERSMQLIGPLFLRDFNERLQCIGINEGFENWLAKLQNERILESVTEIERIFDDLSTATTDYGFSTCIIFANRVLAACEGKRLRKEAATQFVEVLRGFEEQTKAQIFKDDVSVTISAYSDPRYRFATFSCKEVGSTLANRKEWNNSRLGKFQFKLSGSN